MIRFLLTSFPRRLLREWSLALLTLSGVALGVGSVLAIQILHSSALGAFSAGVRVVGGGADLSLVGTGRTFEEEIYPRVLAQAGVAAARPLYTLDVLLEGHPGLFLQVQGIDFVSWGSRFPGQREDLALPLRQPGWSLVPHRLAQRLGWQEGDHFQVVSGTRRFELQVGRVVDLERVAPLLGARTLFLDLSQAQLLGGPGRLSRIDIELQPGASTAEVQAALEQSLPGSVQIVTPEEVGGRADHLLGPFRLNLTALSLISLLVGLFLIHTSTRASLERRRLELGLLRSLGATRFQTLTLLFSEVALLALAGTALGIPLGYLAARAALGAVNSTLSNLYLLEEIERLEVPGSLYLLAAAVGIGGALAAALLPAREAVDRAPVSLLSTLRLQQNAQRALLPLLLVGSGIPAAAGLWYLFWGSGWQPAGFVLAAALLLALPCLSPALVALAGQRRVRRLGAAYSLRSLAARLASSAFVVASIGMAISMLVGMTLLVGSFRHTVRVWLEMTLQADLYISPAAWRSQPQAVLDEALVSSLATMPGVRALERLRKTWVSLPDRRIPLLGVEMGPEQAYRRFPLVSGDPSQVLEEMRRGAVLISEPLARKSGLAPGDLLRVRTAGGPLTLPVAGVYYDYSSEWGVAALELRTLERLLGRAPPNAVSLDLEPGVSAASLADRIRTRFPHRAFRIRSNRRLKREALRVFDQTFAVVRLLESMCLGVAVFAVALTLMMLGRSENWELALYRALGATRGQIFRFYLGKGMGMAALALVLGTAGGIVLSRILIFVINRAYFDWTIVPSWPWATLAGQALLVLGAGAAASLYPALAASRTPATELSREEL